MSKKIKPERVLAGRVQIIQADSSGTAGSWTWGPG